MVWMPVSTIIYDYKAFLAVLPKGPTVARNGDSCDHSPFQISLSNIGEPINDHSTDVVNGWVIKQGDVTIGWIAKIRDGKAYYLNPLGFSAYQELTDDNVGELQQINGATIAGCFKDDFRS